MEPGESPKHAALRELCEETAICTEVGNVRLISVRRRFCMFVGEIESEERPQLDEEHTAYEWAPVLQAPDPLHPGLEELLCRPAYQVNLAEWFHAHSRFLD